MEEGGVVLSLLNLKTSILVLCEASVMGLSMGWNQEEDSRTERSAGGWVILNIHLGNRCWCGAVLRVTKLCGHDLKEKEVGGREEAVLQQDCEI